MSCNTAFNRKEINDALPLLFNDKEKKANVQYKIHAEIKPATKNRFQPGAADNNDSGFKSNESNGTVISKMNNSNADETAYFVDDSYD
jgi:hypothetical protein